MVKKEDPSKYHDEMMVRHDTLSKAAKKSKNKEVADLHDMAARAHGMAADARNFGDDGDWFPENAPDLTKIANYISKNLGVSDKPSSIRDEITDAVDRPKKVGERDHYHKKLLGEE